MGYTVEFFQNILVHYNIKQTIPSLIFDNTSNKQIHSFHRQGFRNLYLLIVLFLYNHFN